jgi:hypothetical protein
MGTPRFGKADNTAFFTVDSFSVVEVVAFRQYGAVDERIVKKAGGEEVKDTSTCAAGKGVAERGAVLQGLGRGRDSVTSGV